MDLGGTEKRVKQDQNTLYEILKGIISNLFLETKWPYHLAATKDGFLRTSPAVLAAPWSCIDPSRTVRKSISAVEVGLVFCYSRTHQLKQRGWCHICLPSESLGTICLFFKILLQAERSHHPCWVEQVLTGGVNSSKVGASSKNQSLETARPVLCCWVWSRKVNVCWDQGIEPGQGQGAPPNHPKRLCPFWVGQGSHWSCKQEQEVCSPWDVVWKAKTGDRDPQLGEVQEKGQFNEYQEEEWAGCVCLNECIQSKGSCLYSVWTGAVWG